MIEKSSSPSATRGESPDEWYEREKTAFRAWWESEGEKTFSRTTTLAAGAGWFARAEAASETAPIVPCLAPNGCTTPEWCARNGDACRVKTPVSERGEKTAADWYREHTEDEVRREYQSATDYDAPDHIRGEPFEKWAEAEGYIRGDALKTAPSATPRSATTDLGKLVEGWQAEEDAVNRDAARYRWLRDAPTGDQLNDITDAYWESPEDFDETVDKAMKEAE